MSQINIRNLSFSYYPHYHKVFDCVTLQLDSDWKLGVIGRNGRGKTTFLKLLSGTLSPQSGHIEKQVTFEYFPFDYIGTFENTLDIMMECAGHFRSMEQQLEQAEILQAYMDSGGFQIEGRIRREVQRMGLSEELLKRNFSTLSGGEQTKLLLAALFVKPNSVVLLDEPTNHLDIGGKQEVALYLKKKKGFMVVSHDRNFLDEVVDHIVSINKSDIKIEKGNYSTWKHNKDVIEEYEFRTKKNLTREIKQLTRHADKKRNWAMVSNTQKYPFTSNSRTNGVQAYFRQAKRAEQGIENNIKKKQTLLSNYEESKDLNFCQLISEADWLIQIEHLSYSYTPSRILLQDISLIIKQGDAVWIKGCNGSGKTTLLKLISKQIPSSAVLYHGEVEFSYLQQDMQFEDHITADEFLRQDTIPSQYEESLQLCDRFDISSENLSKLCSLYSSGEIKKLVLAKLLCQKTPILILDEPLNYMDIMFREQLERAILQIKPTVIFVEHDEHFGNQIATKIIELSLSDTR